MSQLVWIHVRHLLEVLIWALVLAFATAAGTWCCGYAVREVWLKAGPPARRARSTATGPGDAREALGDGVPSSDDSVLAREAERGIREIEKYLAEICPQYPGEPGDPPSS